MFWAACCPGFIGFLPAGEFTTNSSFDHIIHLMLSYVQADSLFQSGPGNSLIYPLVVLANFLALRGPSLGPLFCYADGRPLPQQQLSFTSILHSAGYHGSYSGNSFWIGAATTAASPGVLDHLIKALGQWSIYTYQLYTCTPVGSLVQVSTQLV